MSFAAPSRTRTLQGADFTFAILARATFAGASLAGSDWSGAYLYRTDLSGVDMSAVKGLTSDQVALACGDDATRLPDGIDRPDTWFCED